MGRNFHLKMEKPPSLGVSTIAHAGHAPAIRHWRHRKINPWFCQQPHFDKTARQNYHHVLSLAALLRPQSNPTRLHFLHRIVLNNGA
jgi:uncharacterized protein (DUF924 family)